MDTRRDGVMIARPRISFGRILLAGGGAMLVLAGGYLLGVVLVARSEGLGGVLAQFVPVGVAACGAIVLGGALLALFASGVGSGAGNDASRSP